MHLFPQLKSYSVSSSDSLDLILLFPSPCYTGSTCSPSSNHPILSPTATSPISNSLITSSVYIQCQPFSHWSLLDCPVCPDFQAIPAHLLDSAFRLLTWTFLVCLPEPWPVEDGSSSLLGEIFLIQFWGSGFWGSCPAVNIWHFQQIKCNL